jgi:Ca2+-binding RTX toxin-like protein
VNALGTGQTATDTFDVTAEDGTTQAVTITLTGANDAATLTTTSISESIVASAGTLIFNTANSNLISVGDVDTGESLTVTLSAFNGTFDLTNSSGVSFGTGTDGESQSDVTMIGSVSQINAALNGMSFTASGAMDANLFINIADGGENGALPTSAMIDILVGSSDVPQAVDLTSDDLDITNYDPTTPIFIAGVSASQISVEVGEAVGTVIGYLSNSLTLGSFTGALDGTSVQFDDGSLLKTALVASTLKGSALKDQLIGSTGNDILRGYAGADKLIGNDGSDIIYGGTGADDIYGGLGNDLLYGGDSSVNDNAVDTFNYTKSVVGGEGSDLIVGFKPNQDKINFAGGVIGDVTFTLSGNNTLVTLANVSGTTKITLIGVTSGIHATDFSFGNG